MKFLKKEIEKYRMELKNREANFNRVFAEKTPLIIKKPAEITAEEMVSDIIMALLSTLFGISLSLALLVFGKPGKPELVLTFSCSV